MKKNKQYKRHVLSAIDTIKNMLDQNPQGDTTIKMAQQFGISRNVLQAAFKQQYGLSIREYKLQKRMERSRDLLEQGKEAKVVSLEMRYATQSGFTSAFKKYFGTTPSDLVNGYAHT